ncbi:type I secretion C-terminal target domain-containing protein, partial [Idiomarina sp. Sol25]|uniref:type I secretion C-terminal target domain-containing protein n=1 Tax=Idiomarina sp. Sol25 TaxID=3064000 RepID=UPI00294B799C
ETLEVTAVLEDQFGNTSAEGSDSAVLRTGPTIDMGETVSLLEAALTDGNAFGEGAFTVSGGSDNMTVSLQGNDGLMSQGEPVQWSWNEASGTLIGHTGDINQPVLTVALQSPTGSSNEWSYEVTLQGTLDHSDSESADSLSVPIEVVVNDGYNEVTETVSVSVTDDVPTTDAVSAIPVELENIPDVLLGEVSFTDSGSGSRSRLEVDGVTVTAKGFANNYNTELEKDEVNLSSVGIGVDSGYSGESLDEHGHRLENEIEYRITDDNDKGVSEQLIFDLGDKVAYGAKIEFSKMYGGEEVETGVARFYRDGEPIAEKHFTSDKSSGDFAAYFDIQEGGFDQITIEATDNRNRSSQDNSDLTVKSITFKGASDAQAIASAEGQLDYDAGADGLGAMSLTSFDSDLYNAEGQLITAELDGSNRLIGRVEGSNEVAFEVLLTPQTGQWEFRQYQNLQDPNGAINFAYQVTDGDGDTATGSFGIEPALASASVSIDSISATTESGVDAIDAVWGGLGKGQFGVGTDSEQTVLLKPNQSKNLSITSMDGSYEAGLLQVGDTYQLMWEQNNGTSQSMQAIVTRSDEVSELGSDTDIVVFSGEINGQSTTLVIDSEGISNNSYYFTNDKTSSTVGVRQFEVSGFAEPGAEVEVLDSSEQTVGSATANASGQWSTLLSAETDSQGELTVIATDTQGNVTTDETQYQIGSKANDNLTGSSGDDLLHGGAGSDDLTGGGGNDTFVWKADDEGTVNIPEADTIQDFTLGNFSSDEDADRLDLSDLLQGESADAIDNYLYAEDDGNGNTVLHINSEGNPSGTDNVDQVVTLQDVQMADGQSSSDFIQQMLNDGQLLIDNGSSASTQSSSEGASIDLHQINKSSGLE